MKPVTLQKNFSAGQRRNNSRDQVPGNGVWTSKDFIPDRLGAPLEKRGGWSYYGSAFTGVGTQVRSIAMAPFNGSHNLIAVDTTGQVFRGNANLGSPTFAVDATTETVGPLKQNPYFFLDSLIFPAATTADGLFQSNENSITPYTVGSYNMEYMASFKGRLVGASAERLCFGPAGEPNQAWDDAATYLRSQPIKGLHELRNSLLVFYDGFTERVRGNIPAGYGVSEDDLIIEMLFSDVGLIDAYSIVEWGDQLIWADQRGIYLSDGAGTVDLTDQGGIKDLWIDTLSPLSSYSDWRIASGVIEDLLIVSVLNLETDPGTEVAVFVCDLKSRAWFQFTNCPFTCFAQHRRGANILVAGIETVQDRVADLRTILSPATAYALDADGTEVLPELETAFYRFGDADQRLMDAYVGYQLGISDSGNLPTLTVTYAGEPSVSPTYASAADGTGTLGTTDQHGVSDEGYHYKRVAIRDRVPGASLKIVQTNPSSTTKLYSLSATFIPLSGLKDS